MLNSERGNYSFLFKEVHVTRLGLTLNQLHLYTYSTARLVEVGVVCIVPTYKEQVPVSLPD